jgi:hypothetical protein
MSLRDDINIPLITVLGITSGLLVAVAIVGTQAGYNYVTQAQLARNYDDAEKSGLLSLGQKTWQPQRDKLNSKEIAWNLTPPEKEGEQPKKEFVHIGLERAMEIMIETKGAGPAR